MNIKFSYFIISGNMKEYIIGMKKQISSHIYSVKNINLIINLKNYQFYPSGYNEFLHVRQIEVNCVSCDSVVIKTNLLKSNYIKMTRKFIFLNFNPPLIIIYVAMLGQGKSSLSALYMH